MGLKNELGNIYGYLTVIERAENDQDGRAQWKCKCKCGNEVIVSGKRLRNGNTKSCGCYQKERATQSNLQRGGDLTGKRFGKLTVIKENGFIKKSDGRRARLWQCQCDCGNICDIQHQYLTSGDTTSCGCIRSKGESEIEYYLQKYHINYKREQIFEDLKDNDYLRFDFAIYNKNNTKLLCLIEFQGEQHWLKSNGFYNETIIIHDKIKKDYCEKNNIPLYYFYYKSKAKKQINEQELLKLKEIENYNEL